MSWFDKIRPSRINTERRQRASVPEGLWIKCASCDAVLYRAELERNLHVCPKCNHHFTLTAPQRIESLVDKGLVSETDLEKAVSNARVNQIDVAKVLMLENVRAKMRARAHGNSLVARPARSRRASQYSMSTYDPN